VIALYLFSRILWLTRFPPFIDETIHILLAIIFRLGELGAGYSEGRWLTTTMIAPLLSLPGEPLLGARILSVIAGLFSTIGLFYIGKTLFNIRIGLLAASTYVIVPYALFFDRLALADGLVVTFGVWIVFVTIRTLRSENGMYSVLLALLLILSFLAKDSAMIYIMIPLLAILTLVPFGQWLAAIKKVLPALLGSAIILLFLLFGDFGAENVRGKYELVLGKTLINLFLINGNQLVDWAWRMLSPVLAVASLMAIGWSLFIKQSRIKWFLISLLILSICPYLIFATKFYPRYVFFSLVPLILLFSCFLSWLVDSLLTLSNGHVWSKFLPVPFLLTLFAWPMVMDYQILVSPENASLPALIRWQYFEGWPSGYGVRQLAEYLSTEAREMGRDELFVFRPFMGGQVYGSGLDLYLYNSENLVLSENMVLEVIGKDPEVAVSRLSEWLSRGHRIVIVADTANPTGMAVIEQVSPFLELERIWYYPRPNNNPGFAVWEVHQEKKPALMSSLGEFSPLYSSSGLL